MKPWKWIKEHPAEAMAIAAALAITGGTAAGFIGGGAAAAGAAEGSLAGASLAAGEEAAAIAVANAAAAGGGEAVSGSALLAPLAADAAGSVGTDLAAMYGGGFPAPSSIAGAGAEASLYGPGAATNPAMAMGPRESTWLSRMTPKSVMQLGMMTANLGAPRPQGGPQGAAFEQPAYRSAMHSQEEITKAWLLRNDPNTYRRIYGNPQGVA